MSGLNMNEIVLREYTKDEIKKLRDSYPDYIPMSVIMDREKQKIHLAESERLQNGIRKLSKGKISLKVSSI